MVDVETYNVALILKYIKMIQEMKQKVNINVYKNKIEYLSRKIFNTRLLFLIILANELRHAASDQQSEFNSCISKSRKRQSLSRGRDQQRACLSPHPRQKSQRKTVRLTGDRLFTG